MAVDTIVNETADDTVAQVAEPVMISELVEEVSIDGMCGVY